MLVLCSASFLVLVAGIPCHMLSHCCRLAAAGMGHGFDLLGALSCALAYVLPSCFDLAANLLFWRVAVKICLPFLLSNCYQSWASYGYYSVLG
ncbi:hypothetical protein U1Q18_016798 [Sarracenia purpurea var. burkii]